MNGPEPAAARWLAALALGAGLLILWLVQHPYAGIQHDSQLYTLLAHARLTPDLLGNDIMVRFGSQDRFTAFSPIYATAIKLFGTEHAAALLTFLSQVAFVAAATLLARTLMPASLAWLGIALVCAVPAFYGARNVFTVVENFATPRLLAEACALAGLAAFVSKRFFIAYALGLAALVLHPLMAAAGIAVALFLNPMPGRIGLWVAAAACVVIGPAIAAIHAQGQPLQFNDGWLQLLQTGTDYLFPSLWPVASWAREAVVLATLIVGALVLEQSPARSLCIAVTIAAAAGTAVSYVGGDLLRIVLIVQLQLWRWNWIAVLAASLLLPLILTRAWSQFPFGRSIACLLGAAWLVMTFSTLALAIVAVLVPLAVISSRETLVVTARLQKSLFVIGAVVAGIAVLYHILITVLAARAGAPGSGAVDAFRAFSRTGALPWLAFLALFALVYRVRELPGRVLATVAGAIVLALLLPIALREWTSRTYGPDAFRAFASWRERIPKGAEVLWFDSPLSSWLLLQRPSYLSNQQEASALFSSRAAAVMKARVDMIAPHLESTTFVGWSDPAARHPDGRLSMDLAGVCHSSDVKYVVTRSEVAGTLLAATPPDAPSPFDGVRLYGCP